MTTPRDELPERLRAIASSIDENSYMHPLCAHVDVMAAARIIEECKACNAATHEVIREMMTRIKELEKKER